MGFDAEFLGVEAALPLVDEVHAQACVDLDYVHFTVVHDRSQKFARVTGVNIDGARLVKIGREDNWSLDDRVPADEQAGPAVYRKNDLDRGHLVRRNDPVWGEPDEAAQANEDTFHFTNAAPQASGFNQSKELWVGLEDHVLDFADVEDLKVSVFTAPIFGDEDPPYRGIRVPLRFWKVAAWRRGDELAAAGFVLDQSPVLDLDELARGLDAEAPEEPELGPFRTFQVPIFDIETLTGLSMPALASADRMPPTAADGGWFELDDPRELFL